MIYAKNEGIRISAIAAAVPEKIFDIRAKLDDPNEDVKFIKNFIRNTGIAAKHVSTMEQNASDFACAAARQIQNAGKYTPDEIGVLINITQTPDYRTPSTALALHKRLGLSESCLAFDINLGCSGFVYGVSVASALLLASNASKALVTIGDILARRRGKAKKVRSSNTSWLFGDASSAILLEKDPESCVRSGLMSDGKGHKALASPYNAWKHPDGPESIPGDDIAIFNFTIREVPELINDFLKESDSSIDDYDALALHQANMMIIKNVAKRVGISMDKVPVCLDRFGNTSGASVPLSLVDRYGSCEEDKDLFVLASGFGIGLSWGVIDFRINSKDILPMWTGAETYDDGYPDKFDDEDENENN